MYAVVRTGSKQYRVSEGSKLHIERVPGNVGDSIELPEVLLVSDDAETKIGQPLVEGASVQATITSQERGPKLVIFKKKRRQGYRRKQGHRQDLTQIEIGQIRA